MKHTVSLLQVKTIKIMIPTTLQVRLHHWCSVW